MRQMGMSGIAVAPIALGGNVFGWTADEATSFRLLDAFVDAGGNMIDTADVYSAWVPGHQGGESETVIGRWLRRDPAKRNKVVIASKTGMMGGLAPDKIAEACDQSLRRLGVQTIDLYYEHKDDEAVPLTESLEAFERLREAGKIAAVGVSNFSAARLEEALDVAVRAGWEPAAAMQGWYNLVERGKFEDDIQDVVTGRGVGFFSYYSLANGFLAGKYRSEADLGKSVRGGRNREYVDSDKGRAVLAALDEVAGETGAAQATVALAWTKAQPGVTAAIASATSEEQMKQLVGALTLDLSPAQLQRLDEASA
ncbi:aldo/keto reductase [Sphingomonas ginkgonis]|uniref:Aldo/keto reductase n=1 Tax=Sphingomonas ginkgonis TaxID=2315330 RepID=A0A3R9YJL0_9SPHN|nr:aldo/keto reductase [Sphingomonas ginkgonis]RST31408.1 aldo/keto reductase [Sphingomonas ginkgonis]